MIAVHGDTEIQVTDFHERDLPHLAWALGCDVDPDELTTTMIEIRSGNATPHTTICIAQAKNDPQVYHCLWWNFNHNVFHAFTMPQKDAISGYQLVQNVLTVIRNYEKKG